ncbi:MAG: hypothetical protein R3D84_15350 [Paracoccaceae bacterium]
MSDTAFKGLAASALVLLLAMTWAGPDACGGVWRVCLFDAPHFPYGVDTARAYLTALTDTARWRYLWVVQPLDLLLPAALCLALREAFQRWAAERMAQTLSRLAVYTAGIDYLENALIRVMLKDPAGLSDIVAPATSALTLIKWLMLAVLFGALARLVSGRRRA